jgi:hypothetical protein
MRQGFLSVNGFLRLGAAAEISRRPPGFQVARRAPAADAPLAFMLPLPLSLRAWAVACALVVVARAQPVLPAEPVPLSSLSAFKPGATGWSVAGDLAGDPRTTSTVEAVAGTGVLIAARDASPLLTGWDHGDLQLDLEFLLLVGTEPQLLLQGRYALPLSAAGWSRRGTPAGAAAVRAPGLWQRLRVDFKAPRFDASGAKTSPAMLTQVVVNGFVVARGVELAAPDAGALAPIESAAGPLALVSSGSPVAIRSINVKRFTADTVAVGDLRYRLYAGSFSTPGSYDQETPKSEGALTRFAHGAVEKSGRYALVFTGSLTVPRAGAYRFAIESRGPSRLLINGQPVVTPIDRGGSQPGVVTLTAGRHEFRADLVHAISNPPQFDVTVEGPGIAPQALTAAPANARAATAPVVIAVEPTDRVLLQRAFVPFEPRKRLYAAAVGTPAGVHYAYDFETGSLLHAWRGSFINTVDMWENRGNDQLARATGPVLTFDGKPTVGLLEYPRTSGWPDRPEDLWVAKGYTLEPNGQPVFQAELAALRISDRIAPTADGRGLARTLQIKGSLPSWSAWVLLAEGDRITPRPGGWVVGDRAWYVDWPADAVHKPIIRSVNGRQQLAIPLAGSTLEAPINYSLVW